MGATGIRHLAEKLLKLVAFGCGSLGVDKLIAYHVAVCADKPDLCVKLSLKKMLKQVGRCGLAVCSGNADDRHIRGRIAEIVAGCNGKSIAAVFDHDIGNVKLRLSLTKHHSSTLFRCRGYIIMPVGLKADYCNECVTGLGFARIVAYAAYLGIHRRRHFNNINVL